MGTMGNLQIQKYRSDNRVPVELVETVGGIGGVGVGGFSNITQIIPWM